MDIDVTDKVSFGDNDVDCLPIYKCVCGQEFKSWSFIIRDDEDAAVICSNCGKAFYFRNEITIYQVEK
jgi:transcription elongation factor Elf1